MTFEDLNALCAALRANEVNFDYLARTLNMTVTPEYGFDERIKGGMFQIVFKDCIYFGCSNGSKTAKTSGTEFISWGKHSKEFCGDGSCGVLLDQFLSQSGTEDKLPTPRFLGRDRLLKTIGDYNHYLFENAFGDAIDILCLGVEVIEVKREMASTG